MLGSLPRRLGLALLVGAAGGAIFLGAGGRLVMRAFALATERPPTFTLQGLITVVFAGAVAGALGGILLLLTERFLPTRLWLRGPVFAALCFLVASPGFRPPRVLVLALFAPVFLAYGLVTEAAWDRLGRRRPSSCSPPAE